METKAPENRAPDCQTGAATDDIIPTGYEPLYEEEMASASVPRIKNILVPIDFSPSSEKALAYAAALARQFEAKITMLHILQVQFYANEFAYMPLEDCAMCDGMRGRLDAMASRKLGIELLGATIVRNGVPFDEIVKAARELDSDMIVISTRGLTGLKHLLIGSTAERVVRYAPCPVLVVGKREHDIV